MTARLYELCIAEREFLPPMVRIELDRLIKVHNQQGGAFATEEERELVSQEHCSDDIEIDDLSLASRTDWGCWVSGWLWCPKPEENDDDA